MNRLLPASLAGILALTSCSKQSYSFQTQEEFATGRAVHLYLTRKEQGTSSITLNLIIESKKEGKQVTTEEREIRFQFTDGAHQTTSYPIARLLPFGLLKYSFQEGYMPPSSIDELVIRSTNSELQPLHLQITPGMINSYQHDLQREKK